MAVQQVSAERVIAAPAATIFDLLADPTRHAEIDGSGSVRTPTGSPARLSLGATFGMSMKRGIGYSVKNVVTAYEENREIAWRHGGGGVWRYRLAPIDGGTRVTESFEYGGLTGRVIAALGFPKSNQRAIEQTLGRLARVVSG